MAQNSLLTETQREFLRASESEREEKYSKQQRSYHRQNIHERLRAGIPDFSIILHNLPPEEIEQALEIREIGGRGDPGDLILEIGVADAVGVAHIAYRDRDLGRSEGEFIAKRVEKGIQNALNRLGKTVRSVDVSLEVDVGEDIDSFGGRGPEELAEFSIYELQQVLTEDRITPEQFMAAMEKKGLTRDEE